MDASSFFQPILFHELLHRYLLIADQYKLFQWRATYIQKQKCEKICLSIEMFFFKSYMSYMLSSVAIKIKVVCLELHMKEK
jgi:hypothetical protein